jgi:hypothetical protein
MTEHNSIIVGNVAITHYAVQKWDKNKALLAEWEEKHYANTIKEPADRWFVPPRFLRSELRL